VDFFFWGGVGRFFRSVSSLIELGWLASAIEVVALFGERHAK
jgi:hypothetical protein